MPPPLGMIVVVKSCRDGQQATRTFLLSKHVPLEQADELCRNHWVVENRVHYVLDTAFKEDANKAHTGNVIYNFANLNRACINMIRTQIPFANVRKTLKRTSCNDALLLEMIARLETEPSKNEPFTIQNFK